MYYELTLEAKRFRAVGEKDYFFASSKYPTLIYNYSKKYQAYFFR